MKLIRYIPVFLLLYCISNTVIHSQPIQWELLKKQQGNLTLAIQAVAAYGEKHCAFAAYEYEGEDLRYFQYIQISSDGGGHGVKVDYSQILELLIEYR